LNKNLFSSLTLTLENIFWTFINVNGKKYFALHRGVNVKGTTMIMDVASTVLINAGVKNVSLVMASGNIIFESDIDIIDLKLKLEKAMADFFKHDEIFP
jgi:uncharacterized protein (DUF1697 family)